MSIRLMSAIFESESLGPTERLIMLALADHADDAGRCYPSMARLARRTGLSERAIQTNIKKLTDAGYLKVILGGGKSNSNVYFVSANPAADAPYSTQTPQQVHPAGNAPPAADAPQTPQQVRPNPAADAPEPSGTIIKPSEEGSIDPLSFCNDEAKATLGGVDDATKKSAQAIQAAFAEYNSLAASSGWPRAQLMTKARKAGIAARLRDCGGLEGWKAALGKARDSPHCCGQNQRGWVADLDFIIQPKSFTRLMEGFYDQRTPVEPRRQQAAKVPSNRADPAIANIARIVGLSPTSGNGRG